MHHVFTIRAAATVLLITAASPHAGAENWRELFTDPQDGRMDASKWLLQRRGFLPVPIIITEPAVGYGGGLGVVFFHRQHQPAEQSAPAPEEGATPARGEFVPPSVSAVFAAATENGTKIGGAGHLGIWRNNTLRFTGGIAAMDVNLTFYGGANFPNFSDGVEYNLKGWGAMSQLVWRLGKSDFWIGPQVIYLDATAGLEGANVPPIFDQLNGDVTNTGAGIVMTYDSRDNIFTPSRGFQSEWYVREHWGSFNGDFDYTEVDGKNRLFFNPGPKWVLGWRLDTTYTSNGAPFYALPFINQRGIQKGRYQDDVALTTEVETRYDIDGRWFGVAFAGVGRVADSYDELGSADSRWAGGVGVRYLISRLLGLQTGLDVAKGPEEWAFYLQVGSGWGM